ncbi:hypothetical protein [Streptomyces sp. NPDC005166]
MVYRLNNGYRVRTTRVDSGIEFETRNAKGDTISTVVHPHAEAVPLIAHLRIADGMRFCQVYGGGVR